MKSTILIFVIVVHTFFSEALFSQTDTLWSLNDCIDYAFEKNIQIRKSELTNERLMLSADQAKAQRMPFANASVSHNFNWNKNSTSGESGMTGTNGSNYSINSGLTLYNASRITNLIKQSELEIAGGLYSIETLKESISLSILNAYLQILYAEDQVNNSVRQIESTTGQLHLANERLALKVISQADYAQVRSQLASEKLTHANAVSQLAIARVNLLQLMELPATAKFEIIHPDPGMSINENRIPDVKAVYEAALLIKPQVKNAGVNKEIAALDEKIARADLIPSLTASAGISSGYSTTATELYFNQLYEGIRPSVGFTLSIPIYQKTQVRTNIASAKIGYQDALLTETDTKNQLRKNIEQSCQDVISAQIEYQAGMENYLATKESSSLSDEKFAQGIINSVDYLVSKTKLIVAESQLLQSKYNLIVSYKIMDFYMGIPLSL